MGEVSEMFNLNISTIRYWEREFDVLKPKKNNKGNRLFTPDDIINLKVIYHLLKIQGHTLKGAKKRLAENKTKVFDTVELVERLENVNQMLVELKTMLTPDHIQ